MSTQIYKTKPFNHQVAALERSWDREAYGYLMEMGAGKSKVLVDNMAKLYLEGQLDFALVIAPKGVYQNWINKEIPEHLSDAVPRRVIQWVASPSKKQQAEMRSIREAFDGLTIFVMNVEAFSYPKGKAALEWMANALGRRGLIGVDESTTIKNHKAKRTKALLKAAAKFRFRRILTGSPITKSPMDAFAQFEFLGPGILGFKSYYSFQSRYAVLVRRSMGAHSFDQIVGYRNLDELTQTIERHSYRVLKKDCLDLPEKTYTKRLVDLTEDQYRMYEQLRKHGLTLLEDGEMVSAPVVITQMLRMQQVLCGHLKTDEGEMVTFPSNRINAVKELVAEHSGKAIIWSRFRYGIQGLVTALNEEYGEGSAAAYYGDTTPEERAQIVRNFQDPNHPLRYFVSNKTGAYGITLTAANLVIYESNDFDLETRLQSEDRAHRIGQHNPVLYVDLISPGTIDEKIVESLRNKIELGAKVLGEEVREWLNLKPSK